MPLHTMRHDATHAGEEICIAMWPEHSEELSARPPMANVLSDDDGMDLIDAMFDYMPATI